MTTQLEQQREDQALGAAWRRLIETDPQFLSLEWRRGYVTVRYERTSTSWSFSKPTVTEALADAERVSELWS